MASRQQGQANSFPEYHSSELNQQAVSSVSGLSMLGQGSDLYYTTSTGDMNNQRVSLQFAEAQQGGSFMDDPYWEQFWSEVNPNFTFL